MRSRRLLLALTTGITLVVMAALGGSSASGAGSHAQPTRVLLIVVDQLRPEFIRAFDMRQVQALRAGGTSFPRAYLGHLASETVVSHNVLTSGQLPKHMGWSDEWYRDAAGVLGAPGKQYVTGSMSRDQFNALISHGGYPKLDDYLHAAFPNRVTAAVGRKTYAVNSFGGPSTDIQVTMSSDDFDCDGDGEPNWRGPVGDNTVNVPRYLKRPVCGRFYIDSADSLNYGTATTSPAWMYPLEGNRDVPGRDPEHLGGDVWAADAAMKIMANENWSGLFVTLGGVDKAGHMWGGLRDTPPFPAGAQDPMSHLPFLARTADEQVGRMIHKLDQLGQLDETLVVLTTDHGQLWSKHFYGENGSGRGYYNWYYGSDDDEEYLDPQPALRPLVRTGNVETSIQDSAIRTWLVDRSRAAKERAADKMATLSGVIASYFRTGDHYTLRWRIDPAFLTDSELRWFNLHGQELVDTQAARYGPDVIGLLHDNSSYGVAGDHGGAQRSVQRIPVMFYGADVPVGQRLAAPIRSVDVMPTILRHLGIPRTHPTDGIAYRLR